MPWDSLKKFAVSLLRQDDYVNISQPNSAFAEQHLMYQISIITMKANRTSVKNTYCVYTVLRYS
jgi:hypothetical protein